MSAHAAAVRTVSILGVTGSIGDSTTDIILANRDRFAVRTVAGGKNVAKLAERAIQLGAQRAVIADEALATELSDKLRNHPIEVGAGRADILTAASETVDLMVCAMVGSAGIEPAMAAIQAGSTIALANKEALVCAGHVMTQAAQERGVRILPLDSEHNALFQVFEEPNRDTIEAITLTASGGPFRTWDAAKLRRATVADALKHPNWSMGQKVTIDSATLANKGLEVIEAYHLFAMDPDAIKVVVHPQSIVHGMVHYDDGSVLAQLGMPDMRTPIAAALAWPNRYQAPQVERLDLASLGSLTFEAPDLDRFPMLRIAFEAMRAGGTAPAIFNAANEVAVQAFVQERCAFHEIATIVMRTLDVAAGVWGGRAVTGLEQILAAGEDGQRFANDILAGELRR